MISLSVVAALGVLYWLKRRATAAPYPTFEPGWLQRLVGNQRLTIATPATEMVATLTPPRYE